MISPEPHDTSVKSPVVRWYSSIVVWRVLRRPSGTRPTVAAFTTPGNYFLLPFVIHVYKRIVIIPGRVPLCSALIADGTWRFWRRTWGGGATGRQSSRQHGCKSRDGNTCVFTVDPRAFEKTGMGGFFSDGNRVKSRVIKKKNTCTHWASYKK